jgi:hypothetical protein
MSLWQLSFPADCAQYAPDRDLDTIIHCLQHCCVLARPAAQALPYPVLLLIMPRLHRTDWPRDLPQHGACVKLFQKH